MKNTIKNKWLGVMPTLFTIFLSSCLTIGDTGGGPGMILSNAISNRLENDLASLFNHAQIPNKVTTVRLKEGLSLGTP